MSDSWRREPLTVEEATEAFRRILRELGASVLRGDMSRPAAEHIARTEYTLLLARVRERDQFVSSSGMLSEGPA